MQARESKEELEKELKKLKEDNKKEVEKEVKKESKRKASLSPGSDTSEATQSSTIWHVQGFPLLPIVLLPAPCYRIFFVQLIRCEATFGVGLFPDG